VEWHGEELMSDSTLRRKELQAGELAWYKRMLEIREFENQINSLFAAGSIRGTTHLCVGQEALAVGLSSVVGPDDVVATTYRGHGIALALGMTPYSLMAEIMGKSTGCAGGLGGSMHLCDSEIGLLPTSAIIGGGIPIATGAALAFQIQKKPAVAIAVFGDATTNIGAFHESLNLAAIWKLPVVFVIDNNIYGEYSRIDVTTPIEDLHTRAVSYAMPSARVDGMDIELVRNTLREALDRARSGNGPTLVEAKTYRFSGHSRADQALYRPEGEFEKWLERDPILTTEVNFLKRGVLAPQDIVSMKKNTEKEILAVIDRAQNDPDPQLSDMFKNITAAGR
jgi:TPP-dependent pyruvate/acetoin dehydrogenase alpha subunit